jgi:hypothetical protein
MSEKFPLDHTLLLTSSSAERRAEVLRVDEERAAARQRELDSQSELTSHPQERIRIWERLHALQLPVAPTHPLVAVIAAQTSLSTRDIRDEQQRRKAQHEPEESGA